MRLFNALLDLCWVSDIGDEVYHGGTYMMVTHLEPDADVSVEGAGR